MDPLQQIQDWWNSTPAIQNVSGAMNIIITTILSYLLYSAKKRVAQILSKDKEKVPSEKVDKLISTVSSLTLSIERNNAMLYHFSNGTNIRPEVKEAIASAYVETKNSLQELSENVKSLVQETVQKVQSIAAVIESEVEKQEEQTDGDLFDKLLAEEK